MQLHVETFLGGLKPELKNKILPFDLQMVVGVKKLALIHKQKLSDLHRVLRQPWIGDSSVGDMEQKLPPGALQLSLDEQLKRKEVGLCFKFLIAMRSSTESITVRMHPKSSFLKLGWWSTWQCSSSRRRHFFSRQSSTSCPAHNFRGGTRPTIIVLHEFIKGSKLQIPVNSGVNLNYQVSRNLLCSLLNQSLPATCHCPIGVMGEEKDRCGLAHLLSTNSCLVAHSLGYS